MKSKPNLENQQNNDNLRDITSPQKEDLFFENLITVEELACAFGLAPRTIRNWVSLREIPFVRFRGKTYFKKTSIEAWFNRKETSCR